MKGRPSYNSFRFLYLSPKHNIIREYRLTSYKPTTAIIGRLIVAPAIPVDIPINVDKPKVNNKTTAAYQPG